MQGMRLRVAILLSLLVIGGLISAVQPAQAGQWVAQIQIACQAKRVIAPNLSTINTNLEGLTLMAVGPAQLDVLYTILCGKHSNGGHVKHVGPPPLTSPPTLCIATVLSPNGKKHTPKYPSLRSLSATTQLEAAQSLANCLILALMLVSGWCDNSAGLIVGIAHTAWVNAMGQKMWELKYFTGAWMMGGVVLPIFGTAGKAPLTEGGFGPNPFAAILTMVPDVPRKLDSCLPPGADSFQVTGVGLIAGISPKAKP